MFSIMHNEEINEDNYDQAHECENQTSTSKFRIIVSQCIAVLGVNFLKLSFGCYTGFTTIFIPILYKENAEITLTLSELTWFGSSCFMTPIGSVLGGILAQCFGTRLLIMITAILYITSGLIFHWSYNASMLLCAQAIAGTTNGMLKSPGFTFTAEIAQPQLRGTLMTTLHVSSLTGIFFSVMLGGYMYWRTIVLVNLTFPAAGLIMMFVTPESPHWLACKNRFHEAELSLAWFRGWTDPISTKTEFHSILRSLKSSSTRQMNDSVGDNIEHSRRLNRLTKMLKLFLQRSFYIPLVTVSYILFINDFSGTYTLQTYAMLAFQKIKSPLNDHTATIILSVIRIAGAFTVLFTIRLLGKRNIMFFSLLGNGTSFILAATFGFLIDQKQLVLHVYYWIPTITMLMAIFMSAAGINKISYLLNSELFPTRLRHIGAGIGHFISALFEAILDKAFLYMVNDITISGVFLVLAIVNIIGFITIYFILPETEGRTLTEIEEHYAGVRNLRDNSEEDKDIVDTEL